MRNFFPTAGSVSAHPISAELKECLLSHVVPPEDPTQAHYDEARAQFNRWTSWQRERIDGLTETLGVDLGVQGAISFPNDLSEEEVAAIEARRHSGTVRTLDIVTRARRLTMRVGCSNALRNNNDVDATPGLGALEKFLDNSLRRRRRHLDREEGLLVVGTLRAMIAYAWPRPQVDTDTLPSNTRSAYHLNTRKLTTEDAQLARRYKQGADTALYAAKTFKEISENSNEGTEQHYRALCHRIDLEIRALTIQTQTLEGGAQQDALRHIELLEAEFEEAVLDAWSYYRYQPLGNQSWVFELYTIAMNRREARRGKDEVRLALEYVEDEADITEDYRPRSYGTGTRLVYSYDGIKTSLVDDTPQDRWDAKTTRHSKTGITPVRQYVRKIKPRDYRDIPGRLILPGLVD